MVSSKEEISYNILEKNLNEYEPITDERIKNFIIENKRLNPFLKEVYPIIKKFFPKNKLVLEYVEDYEEQDWVRLHIVIKIENKETDAEEIVNKHWKMNNEIRKLKRKHDVINLVNTCLF